MAIVQGKTDEHQLPLWYAALGFQKAFDYVEHQGLWNALFKQGVPVGHVFVFKQLDPSRIIVKCALTYTVAGSIHPEGAKQGVLLFSLIFNALLEDIMREAKAAWKKKRYGVQRGHTQE
eukprot:4336523-Pyramimonas_sp.AAC.1